MQKKLNESKEKRDLVKFLEYMLESSLDEKINMLMPIDNKPPGPVKEQINNLKMLLEANRVPANDIPATVYGRKFMALKNKIIYAVEEFSTKTNFKFFSLEMQVDIFELLEAVENDRINEDTIKLARKYFNIPHIGTTKPLKQRK